MIKKIFFIGLVIILASCSSKKVITGNLTDEQELAYYNLFTEATKQALTQNLKTSVELYKRCIEKYPEKAAPYYQVSNIYLSVQDVDKAKNFALKAVSLDNSNEWYLLHLANIYQYENKLDSVIFLYEQIVQYTANPEYKYNLAVFYSSSGQFDKSMMLLDNLEKEFEGMREIIVMRHRNYAALNERDSAIVQLEHLIRLFPDEFENYGLLAEYLSEINRFSKAGKIYKDLLSIEPNNGLANISYGDYFLKQGLKDSALVYYKKGFRSHDIRIEDKMGILFNYIYDPVAVKNDSVFIEELLFVLKENHDDYRPYTLAADYHIKRQEFSKALSELEIAVNKNADSYLVWEQYVMISNYLGKFENVNKVYKKAILKFPDEIKLHIFIAYSLFELEMFQESIDVSQVAIHIKEAEKEDKIQVMNQLADSYRGLQQYEVSDSIYETILMIDPENLLIRNNYSYYLSLRSKNLQKAEELSRLTIRKEPNNPTYLDTYGWILYMQGNYKEALKYLESAIKNGAYNSAEVLDHYGDAAYKLGRCSEAIEAWQEALKYNANDSDSIEVKIHKAEQSCE